MRLYTSDLFNISQSSYKANSNFKSSTTADTLGTINSNISNNSIGSCNKIKNEDKKESKKNLTGTDKKKIIIKLFIFLILILMLQVLLNLKIKNKLEENQKKKEMNLKDYSLN